MPEQMKRKRIRCWNPECKKIFFLLINIAEEPTLSETCPFCGKQLKVTLLKNPKIKKDGFNAPMSAVGNLISVYRDSD